MGSFQAFAATLVIPFVLLIGLTFAMARPSSTTVGGGGMLGFPALRQLPAQVSR